MRPLPGVAVGAFVFAFLGTAAVLVFAAVAGSWGDLLRILTHGG